tara:strand:- start:923 stop:1240 length:318 start_codon:yes stop_codon:yes gene_type:complete
MADVLIGAVTQVRKPWVEGGTNSRLFKCHHVTIALATQGGATNKIPASLFGMSRVTEVSNAVVTDDSIIYQTAPIISGTAIGIGAVASGIPTDVTKTVELVVKGY